MTNEDDLATLLDRIEEVQDRTEEVHRIFADTYQREGVNIWLKSHNRHLDNHSPLILLFMGEYERVIAEANRVSGS